MLTSNADLSKKFEEKKGNDAFVNDIIDSLGPEFKGELTEDTKETRINKVSTEMSHVQRPVARHI